MQECRFAPYVGNGLIPRNTAKLEAENQLQEDYEALSATPSGYKILYLNNVSWRNHRITRNVIMIPKPRLPTLVAT